MDDGISFLELMEQIMLWEDWYTRRFSGPSADALSREDQRLLHMDPNKLLDPGLLAYLYGRFAEFILKPA